LFAFGDGGITIDYYVLLFPYASSPNHTMERMITRCAFALGVAHDAFTATLLGLLKRHKKKACARPGWERLLLQCAQ
jgi:hypothetical protein